MAACSSTSSSRLEDHQIPLNRSTSSTSQLSSARLWLTLLLLVSHHCSTTWSAAVAAREEHRRWMTMGGGGESSSEPPPTFASSSTEEPTANSTSSTQANSTSTAIPNPASTHFDPLSQLAPGVQANHAPGDLSLAPSANHQVTLEVQNSILSAAEAVSLDLTHRIISPLVWVNNRVSQAAGTLPALMAANGALLGTAIAVPIQSTALAANHLAAAGAGTLVTVPISVLSGGTAGALGAFESAREFYHASLRPSLSQAYQTLVPASPLPILVRPAALLGGASSVVGGMALGVVSSSVHSVAEGVERLGDSLAGAGEGISRWGDALVLWSATDADASVELAGAQIKTNLDQGKALNQTQETQEAQTGLA